MTMRLSIAIALSLAGAVISWLGGRRILRHIDDPLFVDRMFAHRILMIRIYMVMVIAIGALAAGYTPALLALFALSIAIGGFPARKALFDESWTMPQYLANRVRMTLFAGGYWIALLTAPRIVQEVGIQGAGVVLAALVLLSVFYHDLLLLGLSSEPLNDPELLARFEPILAKSTGPRPRFLQGGPHTGRFTNAVALPRGKASRILFTRALLRDLDANEVTAVFAHELAHIEHYTKRRNAFRIVLGFFVLPLLAVAPQVVVLMNDASGAAWVSILWPLILLIAVAGALMRRQKHETEADLRALQLGADPLALISGLEKLHRLNRVPRRFDAQREKRMSHPSLARRITAIRRAAGLEQLAPPALPQDFGEVRFTEEEVQVRGAAYRYDALRSLALRKTLRGFALSGRSDRKRFNVPIAATAAADVNAILNWCDSRLAPPLTRDERAPRDARLLALLLLMVSLFPGIPFPPLVMSLLALIAPGAASVAALGATAIAAGILALLRPAPPYIGDALHAMAAAEIVLGVFALAMLRRVAPARSSKPAFVTLGILLAVILIPAAIAFHPDQAGLELYSAARSRPSAAVLMIGMGAALAVSGRKRGSVAVVAAALAFIGCGTRAFAHITGGDPLMTERTPSWVRTPAAMATRPLSSFASRLRISPDAKSVAVCWARNIDDDFDFEIEGGKFAAGPLDGAWREVAAQDVAFAGDRLLRLAGTESGSDLTDGVQWTVRLPSTVNGQLTVDDGMWRVFGLRPRTYAPVSYSGRIGSNGYSAADRTVVQATLAPAPLLRAVPMAALMSMGGGPTEFWRSSDHAHERIGRTVLAAYDVTSIPDSGEWVVIGRDDMSTYVGTVDADRRSIRASGQLPGNVRRRANGSRSRVALIDGRGDLVVWNLRSGKAMRIGCDQCIVSDAAFAERAVGVLRSIGGHSEIAIYSTDNIE